MLLGLYQAWPQLVQFVNDELPGPSFNFILSPAKQLQFLLMGQVRHFSPHRAIPGTWTVKGSAHT